MTDWNLPTERGDTLPDLERAGRGVLWDRARRLGPATGKTVEDMALASVYASQAPKATQRLYQLGQRRFADWCAAEGVPYDFPAHAVTPEALALFVEALGAEGRAPATIDGYVAGVAAMHRRLDIPSPSDAQVVRDAKKALRAAKGSAQVQAQPMRRAAIDAALPAFGEALVDLRDRALIALGYDTMARASELVAFRVSDLREEDRVASILVARSKTDQAGRGQRRFVGQDTMRFLREWIAAAELAPDAPLFRPLSRKGQGDRLTRRDVARIFQRRLGQGLSAHSARVGAAVDQRAAGLTTGEIAQAGGWKGEAMPARYTAHLSVNESAAAKLARMQGRG